MWYMPQVSALGYLFVGGNHTNLEDHNLEERFSQRDNNNDHHQIFGIVFPLVTRTKCRLLSRLWVPSNSYDTLAIPTSWDTFSKSINAYVWRKGHWLILSNRLPLMARDISLVVWLVPLLSNCSTAKKSSLYDVRPWTFLGNSSVLSVRFYTSFIIILCWNRKIYIFKNPCELNADLDEWIVKYHAYLRKMTRYNPTRGGELLQQGY